MRFVLREKQAGRAAVAVAEAEVGEQQPRPSRSGWKRSAWSGKMQADRAQKQANKNSKHSEPSHFSLRRCTRSSLCSSCAHRTCATMD